MANKCFVARGKGGNGYWYENLYCAESVTLSPTRPSPYGFDWQEVMVNGVLTGNAGYLPGTGSVIQVTGEPLSPGSYTSSPFGGRAGNCNGCITQPVTEYDCVNGSCIPKNTYNTPGLYPTLEECELACGTGCSGKCISNSDWTVIEGLANQLKRRNCS